MTMRAYAMQVEVLRCLCFEATMWSMPIVAMGPVEQFVGSLI